MCFRHKIKLKRSRVHMIYRGKWHSKLYRKISISQFWDKIRENQTNRIDQINPNCLIFKIRKFNLNLKPIFKWVMRIWLKQSWISPQIVIELDKYKTWVSFKQNRKCMKSTKKPEIMKRTGFCPWAISIKVKSLSLLKIQNRSLKNLK